MVGLTPRHHLFSGACAGGSKYATPEQRVDVYMHAHKHGPMRTHFIHITS